MQKLRIGTRGSKLALSQAKIVEQELKKYYPELETELIIIKTMGDKIIDKPLSEIGNKGLFVDEFENALLNGEIDIAVHSAKDLPTTLKENLEIICTPARADARDVLIKKAGTKNLRIIGTSSSRREFYVKKIYPKATIKMLRGNVDTRLKKLLSGEYDAIILAKAGIDRLNIKLKSNELYEYEIYETDKFIPAACQGIIAVEAKKNYQLKQKISIINDEKTFLQYKLEREALKHLEASCHDISAVHSKFIDGKIEIFIMYKGKEISIIEEYNDALKKLPQVIKAIKI